MNTAVSTYACIFFSCVSLICEAETTPTAGTTSQINPQISLSKKTPSTSTDLIRPIDLQLRSFRDGNTARAYEDTTSADFKKNTSYDAFQEFVNQNPILKSHKDIEVKPAVMQDNQAEVTVILDPNKDAIPVVYLLVNEDNQWKIWNMAVTPHYSSSVAALIKDPKSLETPIREQLNAIKNNNILSAYKNYNSQDFQKATSLEAFRSFIKDYPILSDFISIEFKEPVIQKTTGQIEVFLLSGNSRTEVEYTLGIEDDQWKIWGMHVIKQSATQSATGNTAKEKSPANTNDNSTSTDNKKNVITVTQEKQAELNPQPVNGPLTFTRIDIGNRVDLKGNVINPSMQLKTNNENIYVNLFVHNGVIGTKIELLMQHVETHSNIPSIATTLESEGNVQISYVFSAEKSGWPPGHYQLIATTSTGIKQTFTFTMD